MCRFLLLWIALISFSVSASAQNKSRSDDVVRLHQLRRLSLQAADLVRAGSLNSAASQSGTISGRVGGLRDTKDLQTAQVVAWTADSSGQVYWKGAAYVEDDSTYQIEGLVEGSYYVMASADGYVSLYYDNTPDLSDATPVEVSETVPARGIDFTLERMTPGTGAIGGTVRDPNGDPVAGAEVYAFSPENPLLYAYTWTADNGLYVLPELKSGSYLVEVRAEGFIPEYFDDAATYDAATPVEVIEPNRVDGVDFDLAVGGSISGLITDADGAPVAGAFIDAMVPARTDSSGGDDAVAWPWQGGWATSDESGFYRVTGLRAGTYVVYAQAWNLWSYSFEWYEDAGTYEDATPVAVTLSRETPGIDFSLALSAETSSLSGRVVDANGDPVQDAFVLAETASAVARGGGYVWAYAVTDREGRYSIEQVPEGSYHVSASAQLGWEYVHRWYPDAENLDAAVQVEVGRNERVENIDIQLPAAAGASSISGVVTNASGEPLANVYVEVSTDHRSGGQSDVFSWLWAHALSDSSGAYRVDRLPEGTYLAHASYWSGDEFGQAWFDGASSPESATAIDLGADESREGVDFRLTVRPIYGVVQGTVTDDLTGEPLERVYVDLSPVGRDLVTAAPLWRMSNFAVTDEKGRFRIEYVTEGSYVLSAYANGAFEHFEDAQAISEASQIAVTGGSEVNVAVALSRLTAGEGSIAGSVLSEDGSPTTIAVVLAQPVDGGPATYTAVTGPDGLFRLSGMPVGSYYVSTFSPGYVGEFFDDAYTPDEAVAVTVDGVTASAVDFRLWPIYYLAPETDAGRAAAAVYGTVVDENGNAVAGATVYILDASEKPISSAQTGPDGAFEISGIQPGRYKVYAGKIGFLGGYNGEATTFADAEAVVVSGGRMKVDLTVSSGAATATEDDPELPVAIELLGNYPNPFNPETSIAFRLREPSHVRLIVYDVLGSEVATLLDGPTGVGLQTVRWDGRSTSGRNVASGTYFYRIESGRESRTGGMMLLR